MRRGAPGHPRIPLLPIEPQGGVAPNPRGAAGPRIRRFDVIIDGAGRASILTLAVPSPSTDATNDAIATNDSADLIFPPESVF